MQGGRQGGVCPASVSGDGRVQAAVTPLQGPEGSHASGYLIGVTPDGGGAAAAVQQVRRLCALCDGLMCLCVVVL